MQVRQELIETEYVLCFEAAPPVDLAFKMVLDAKTLERVREESAPVPQWTRLDRHRCGACTLDPQHCAYCPAAVAVADLLEPFAELRSHTAVRVTVITHERTIIANTTAQRALRSLLGLYMATSGCPVLAKFKPMARFHLPFATPDETMFRSVSAYLLAQYFLKRRGVPYELDFNGLRTLYKEIHAINKMLIDRIRHMSKEDANVNALVMLDMFTHYVPLSLDENLADFEHLFVPYFESDEGRPVPPPQGGASS